MVEVEGRGGWVVAWWALEGSGASGQLRNRGEGWSGVARQLSYRENLLTHRIEPATSQPHSLTYTY